MLEVFRENFDLCYVTFEFSIIEPVDAFSPPNEVKVEENYIEFNLMY